MTFSYRSTFAFLASPAVVVASVAALAPPVVYATDLTVCPQGCEFTTIQAAVDAAHSGDVINVGPGTYLENLEIEKSLILNGAGRDKTRLDGRFLNPAITIDSPSGARADMPVVITNMTITHGRGVGVGGGVEVTGLARLELRTCILVSNRSDGAGNGAGGAVNIESLTTAPNRIIDTILAYNHSQSGGGALAVSFESLAEVSGSTLTRNDTAGLGGGILLLNKSVASIRNTSLTENRAALGGGALSAAFSERDNPAPAVTLDGVVIADNSSGRDGGGISGPVLTMSNTVIARNTAANNGGGWIAARQPQVKDAFIIQNTAGHRGGGILTLGPLTATGTTITQNHPDNCQEDPPNGSGCP